MKPLAAVYSHVLSKKKCDASLHAKFPRRNSHRACGSASVCSSFAAPSVRIAMKCTNVEIFMSAGRPRRLRTEKDRRIDAVSVIGGTPQKFLEAVKPLKTFSDRSMPSFRKPLPSHYRHLQKARRDTTGTLLRAFTASQEIMKAAIELTGQSEEKLLMPYEKNSARGNSELTKDGDELHWGSSHERKPRAPETSLDR